jgi:hypothetical protein
MPTVKFSDLCRFTDKQWAATGVADCHRYTLFGGSRGPGKSYWLRWYCLRFLLRLAGAGRMNVDVMLACEDYPSLTGRQITKIATEFPLWLGEVKSTTTKGLGFHLRPEFGGGSILLRNLDDPSKYQSFEFAMIAIDELTKNSARTFDILRGSLRWPGVADTQFVAASNPDANWVRDYWIERKFPQELQETADQFAFVPALPQDNPHLSDSYWAELNTLSGALRQAWLFGDWYAAVEGLVYENFSNENVVDIAPSPMAPVEIAIDDGYIDPRATLFMQRLPNGDLLVFDEMYETKTLEEASIERIKAKCAEHGLPLPELAAVSHEAVALQRRLREANIPARNWLAAKVGGGGSTRLAAITLTRSLICDGQGHRAILVHHRCRSLLDELRAGYRYPTGRHGLETEPADGNDHACNALESYVWLRMRRG